MFATHDSGISSDLTIRVHPGLRLCAAFISNPATAFLRPECVRYILPSQKYGGHLPRQIPDGLQLTGLSTG